MNKNKITNLPPVGKRSLSANAKLFLRTHVMEHAQAAVDGIIDFQRIYLLDPVIESELAELGEALSLINHKVGYITKKF